MFNEGRCVNGRMKGLEKENKSLRAENEILKDIVSNYEDRVIRKKLAELLLGNEGET